MRATAIPEPKEEEEQAPPGFAQTYFIMVPSLTYKAIIEAAAKRNMTVAQLVSTAFSDFLKKTGD